MYASFDFEDKQFSEFVDEAIGQKNEIKATEVYDIFTEEGIIPKLDRLMC